MAKTIFDIFLRVHGADAKKSVQEAVEQGMKDAQGTINVYSKSGSGVGSFGLSPSAAARNPELVQKLAEKAAREAATVQKKVEGLRPNDLKNLLFNLGPILNPGGVFKTLFAARQNLAFFGGQEGQSIFARLGLGGGVKNVAFAAGLVTSIALAVGIALKGLEKAIHETIQGIQRAIADAHKLYAEALNTPGGIGFVARRDAIARVLGVDPAHALAYGASNFVGQKTAFSSSIIGQNATDLASVSVAFKVMDENLKALFSTLADKVAPTMIKVANAVSLLAESLEKFLESKSIQRFLNASLQQLLGNLTGINPVIFAILKNALGLDKISPGDKLPNAGTFARQLPASSLERMGLVVGGGFQNDLLHTTKRIAKASEKTAQVLSSTFNAHHPVAVSPLQSAP